MIRPWWRGVGKGRTNHHITTTEVSYMYNFTAMSNLSANTIVIVRPRLLPFPGVPAGDPPRPQPYLG
jgi:hypothetical protein